jgi:hypothetical protein
MRNKGRSTIGDTLSEAVRRKFEQMVFELSKGASDAVARQLKQPKPPVSPILQTAHVKAPPRLKIASAKAEKATLGTSVAASKYRNQPRASSQLPKPEHHTQPKKPKAEFLWWELPPEAAVREKAPHVVSPSDRQTFQDIIALGAKGLENSSGEELFINIGLDFGTSSTKVIVRFPYETGEPTFAIPAPVHCRSDSHPYLWQTVLWVRPSGEFLAWPTPGAALLHALKQGILAGHHNRAVQLEKWTGPKVTNAEAATAYLAYVVRYVRGWLMHFRPNVIRNRRLVWSENIGVPAATLDEVDVVGAYRRVAAAAHLAAGWHGELTVDLCRVLLENAQVVDAAGSAAKAANLGVAVIPETAAEATGFFKSNRATEGAYLMVDVGALTLDACMFGYQKETYKLFNAMVRPLGVESFHWFVKEGKSEPGFLEQCQRCLWHVVWRAKTDHVPQVPCWKPSQELPVFLVGGGARHTLHRQVVDKLGPWLRQHASNNGIRFLSLPIPQGLDLPESIDEFGRLAVAWGLSYPPDQIGEFAPPSSIEKARPLPLRSGVRFVSKDQV